MKYRDWLSAFDKYIFIIAQIIFQTASMNTASLEYFKSFSVFIRCIYYKVWNDYLMNFLSASAPTMTQPPTKLYWNESNVS